jgi:hypothetical protein
MSFHSPHFFSLLVPLILILIWVIWQKRKKVPTLQFGSLSLLKAVGPTLKTRLVNLPLILKGLGIALAIFALSRPQTMNTKIRKNVEGIDIVICLEKKKNHWNCNSSSSGDFFDYLLHVDPFVSFYGDCVSYCNEYGFFF